MNYNGYTFHLLNGSPLVLIKNPGQGPVPKNLRGVFTTKQLAIEAIDRHLSTKENKSGKAKVVSKG